MPLWLPVAFILLLVAPLLSLRPADVAVLRERWAVVGLAIAAGALVVVAAVFASDLLPLFGQDMNPTTDAALGALLVLVAPVGQAAPLLAGLTGGNVMLTRALMATSVMPVAFVAPVFFGLMLWSEALVFAVLVLPVALAVARPALTARLAAPAATASSLVTLALAGAVVWRSDLAGLVPSLIFTVAGFALLSLTGWLLGVGLRLDRSDRRTVTLAMTSRNIGLPLAVTLGLEMPMLGVPALLYALLIWLVGLAPLVLRLRAA